MGIKRIFLGTNEIAGGGATLTEAFNKLGIKADFVTFKRPPFGYFVPEIIDISAMSDFRRNWTLNFLLLKSLLKYDAFIFLFGSSLFSEDNRDLKILKKFGKKIASIFLGCDIRARELVAKENLPFSVCSLCGILGNDCDLKKKKALAERFENYADIIFAQPDYAQLLTKEFHYYFLPIDLEDYKVSFCRNDPPVVVHAPSDFKIKGTKYILDAVNRLWKEGYKFEFFLLENMSNEKVKEYLKKSDIVIDQLLAGWHGFFALEAMAYGKPVLGYIRKDLLSNSPELPIISTDPDNIYMNLKLLLENFDLREEAGRRGRIYAEMHHDSVKIARRIIELLEAP